MKIINSTYLNISWSDSVMHKKLSKQIIYLAVLLLTSLCLAQTDQLTSEQSNGGGSAQEDSISMIGIIGQPGPPGRSVNNLYFLSGGFISTMIDSFADPIPPGPPENIAVSPNVWSNINTFSVNWINPADASGIEKAYYKLGSAPISNFDTTASVAGTPPLDVILTQGGQHDLYLWLEDGSGNTYFEYNSRVVLLFDNSDPIINHIPVTSDTAGSEIIISATASDQFSGLNLLYLYYRETGDISGLDSVLFVGTSAVIPASLNTQRGIEYSIAAKDNAGNYTIKPEINSFYSIQVELTGDGGVAKDETGQPIVRHSGSKLSDYRIFSIPFVLEDKKPSSVFENDLGAYDPVKWKLFSTQDGELKNYNAIKNLDIVQPGRGFLLILNMQDKYIYSGNGHSPDVITYSQIQLTEGWNLVGNPFDFDIPLNKLTVNGIKPEAYSYNDSGWVMATGSLNKWEGLAIYDSIGSVLNIDATSGSAFKYLISDRFAGNDWGIKITARGEESLDLDNYIGVYSPGNKGERVKWHEPPRLANAVSLRIQAQQNTLQKGNSPGNEILSTQIQPRNDEGNYWDFEIVGDKAGEKVLLDLEYFADIPEEHQKYMIDLDVKTVIDLSNFDSQLDLNVGKDKKRRLRILIGNESFVSANAAGIDLKPQNFELRQNFPNPFNPNTNIIFTLPHEEQVILEIYNVLGQKIKTLINNEMYRTGYHNIEWNGRNNTGESVASGMYIFRLQASNKVKIRKSILMK